MAARHQTFSPRGAAPGSPLTVFTVGHSTRTADELIALLKGNGVALVVDVRRFPASRRYPQFAKEALAATLAGAGIA